MNKWIEEITLNTWPAEQSVLLNGWVLRTSSGYTKRANSVNPLYAPERSGMGADEQFKYAEAYYQAAGLVPVFKITPFIQPEALDGMLELRGYRKVEPSSVRVLDLKQVPSITGSSLTVHIEDHLNEEWLSVFSELAELTASNRDTLRRMLSASSLKQGYAVVAVEGIPAACGLGILQRGYLGLYDIVTAPAYRRTGLAVGLIKGLLQWGMERGASGAFLQVLKNNSGASALYDKLGFKEIYNYWYRVWDNT
ncbi:GNAT family N-acetyltransferase [Paenibacillus donghaensis]|uniref:N-acetyltransferase domain-containing protein n=1 Tax=Paenibacillus donghaensis TaxID=414771 RepID=A0A2Z2K4C4_9BACL|nr:GNAT family N-acetyltransferase [Paenibacillus donghaensis]ASA20616.1 hypothetical protein B9T62_07295 [Paenibacillus donghaensis]